MIVLAGVLGSSSGEAQTTNTITGTTVTAIQTITSGNSLSITSTGVIAPTSGAGISIPGSTTIGSVWNDGRIVSTNSNAISPGVGVSISGIYNTGSISAASNVLQSASNSRIGTITNSGTMTGGTGFNLDNTTIGTITNSGLISATGSNGPVSMSGTTSAAALVNTSTGTLTGSQGSAAALQVFGSLTSLTLLDNAGLMKAATGIKLNGTITTLNNSGVIQGTSSSGNALSISSSGRIGTFNNTGTILGNITDLRTGGLTITGGTGTIYGSLTGATIGTAGTITAAGNVTFGGNTALNGNVTSAGGVGRITNTGVLYVQRGTTMTGAYSQPAGATLQIGVVSTATYGSLNVSGNVTLTSGTSIVMMAAPSGTLAAGSYTIFSGPTATDYSGVTVTAPSSSLEVATFTVADSSNSLVVTLADPYRLYWDGDTGGNAANSTVDGGNGTWSSAGINWTNAGGTANGTLSSSTITPFFQGTAGTVTVSGSVSVAGMTFGTNGYLLTGGTIDLTASPSTITAENGVTATIASNLTGSGGLSKTGAGTLVLSGANSFSGGTSVNGGTLALTGTIGAVTIAAGATLSSGGASTGAIANSGTLALGSSVLTVAGNISGTGAITFSIGGAGTGYIVNTTNTANYAPGAGTVTVTPSVSGITIADGAKIALIRGNAGGTAPSFTGTTVSVTGTGSATWVVVDGTSHAGTVDLNGYTITANDTVLVATVVGSTSPTPPTSVVTTPVVTTPATPVVPPPTTPPTGVIDMSKPTFTNEDGAVQTSSVTFDGGTLKPSAPLTLTQAVTVGSTNGVIDPNGTTVTLSGSIGGTGQLTVTGSGSLVVSNAVANSGGLAVQSGGLTVAEGGNVSAPVTVTGGTVTVDQGGSVSAPVTVSGGSVAINGEVSGPVTVNNGGTLGGNGLITGDTSVSGILAPGNSPGTLVFTAPVTLTAGSVYQVEIDGTGTGTGAGNHDRVVVNGATFTADGRLTPILRGIGGSATNSFTPSLGQSFTVVNADGGVSGRFASLDQPASGLAAGTRMDVIYGSTAVALAVTPTNYGNLAAAGLGQTVNQRAVGTALESFRPAAGGQASDSTTQALFDNLYTLSGGQIGPALNQLSGEIHADTLTADRANRRQFGRAVEARQAAGHGAVNAPGAEGAVEFLSDGKVRSVAGLPDKRNAWSRAGGASVWGQPLVGRGRSADDGNGGAVNRFTGGFMVGSDYAFDPEVKAGVALGFLRTRVKAENGLGEGTVDSYQATVYGSWTPGAAFVDAALGYGYSRYDTTRTMVFGNVAGVASGEADGTDLSADLSAGTRMTLDGGAWVEPRAGLRWDRLSRDGFTEKGTPLLSLREEAATQNALRSSIGLRVGTRLNVGAVTVEPTGSLGWEHDWADVRSEATGSLNGARFTALASRPGRDAAVVGAGVTVTMTRQLSVQIGYLGEIRRHESNHGLSAKLRWSW